MVNIPDFFATGLIDLPWWGYVVVTLILTHVTIAAVTIYLHRAQAHRGLDLHAIPSHFFRFWLWLTTVRSVKEWLSTRLLMMLSLGMIASVPSSPRTTV